MENENEIELAISFLSPVSLARSASHIVFKSAFCILDLSEFIYLFYWSAKGLCIVSEIKTFAALAGRKIRSKRSLVCIFFFNNSVK